MIVWKWYPSIAFLKFNLAVLHSKSNRIAFFCLATKKFNIFSSYFFEKKVFLSDFLIIKDFRTFRGKNDILWLFWVFDGFFGFSYCWIFRIFFWIFKAFYKLMLSMSQNVRPCVFLFVCLFVCPCVHFWGTV